MYLRVPGDWGGGNTRGTLAPRDASPSGPEASSGVVSRVGAGGEILPR